MAATGERGCSAVDPATLARGPAIAQRGTKFAVKMPRDVVKLLEEIAAHAPMMTLAQRAILHRKVHCLIMAGCVNEGWGDNEPGHISYRALDALAPPSLYDMPPLGSA